MNLINTSKPIFQVNKKNKATLSVKREAMLHLEQDGLPFCCTVLHEEV